MKKISAFNDTLSRVNHAAKIIDQDVSFMQEPELALGVYFPVKIAGKTEYFKGYRVQYNSLLGPTKGGIRFRSDVTLDEVKSLSLEMTLKNSLSNIPYGEGKGGVITNSKDPVELDSIMRGYVRSIADIIGPNRDVPAPDMNTNPALMGAFLDEYENIVRHHAPEVVTGKPTVIGGAPGRDTSTAMGAYYITNHLEAKGKALIQGFGNAGLNMATLLDNDKNFTAVGASDSKGGVYDKEGLDIEELIRHKQETGSVIGFNTVTYSNDEFISLEADILFPCASGSLINKNNSSEIKAKWIFELANNPVTSEADKILTEMGVLVYPDILVNSGGVVGSFYEWQANIIGERLTRESFNQRLKKDMLFNLEKVNQRMNELSCNPREAAYIVAIERLIDAKKSRGY